MKKELEWKTIKERIDKKLKALDPSWRLIKHQTGLDTAILHCCAVKEYPTANGPADSDKKFKECIKEGKALRASAIIVAHNHPLGEIKSSKEDIEITKQIRSAGETLGIKLPDHVIFNQEDYYSFLTDGLL